MVPQLQASAASGLGGTGGDLSWNMTIPNLGKNGLIIIAWLGREEGGEQSPEEINAVYFNGVQCTIGQEANRNETGSGFAYLTGASIPAAGTYACVLNFQDNPKQAEKKRGVSAAFTNVKSQAPEVTTQATGSGGSPSVAITPLTNNALVIASWGWRVGFAETWTWGTSIVTSRGDNSAGISLAYSVIATPAAQTVSVGATNPEDWGLAVGSFAMQSQQRGQIL